MGVLDHGWRYPPHSRHTGHLLSHTGRVLAAAVRALTAPEVPALEENLALLGRVGRAAVRVEIESELHETWEAKREAGREAAESFEQVPEAQAELLVWLGIYAYHLPGIEGVEYAVSVMKRFPQHERVQNWGCYALHRL